MSTPIAENPAVLDPRRNLSTRQMEALGSLGFFRHRYRNRTGWQIGNKIFSPGTINALEKHGLVKTGIGSVDLTQAGRLAAERLREDRR